MPGGTCHDGLQYLGQRVKRKLQTVSTYPFLSNLLSRDILFLIVEAANCLVVNHSVMNVPVVIYRRTNPNTLKLMNPETFKNPENLLSCTKPSLNDWPQGKQ